MLFSEEFTSQFHFGLCEHVRIKDKKVQESSTSRKLKNPQRLDTGDFAHDKFLKQTLC